MNFSIGKSVRVKLPSSEFFGRYGKIVGLCSSGDFVHVAIYSHDNVLTFKTDELELVSEPQLTVGTKVKVASGFDTLLYGKIGAINFVGDEYATVAINNNYFKIPRKYLTIIYEFKVGDKVIVSDTFDKDWPGGAKLSGRNGVIVSTLTEDRFIVQIDGSNYFLSYKYLILHQAGLKELPAIDSIVNKAKSLFDDMCLYLKQSLFELGSKSPTEISNGIPNLASISYAVQVVKCLLADLEKLQKD